MIFRVLIRECDAQPTSPSQSNPGLIYVTVAVPRYSSSFVWHFTFDGEVNYASRMLQKHENHTQSLGGWATEYETQRSQAGTM